MSARFPFDNTYTNLPPSLYAQIAPTPVANPRLVRVNHVLAETLGLDPRALASTDSVQILAGNTVPEGAAWIALGYAGHQFGHFVPQLGDGRAVLVGEVVGRDGARRDIQLKGSGRTPYSRGGDGRAAIGPVLREYIISEAVAALGVPTTRSLAAVTTGEPVYREAVLPGAVLTRVAASHIRVGTFQFASQIGETALRPLADYAIARHYPDVAHAPHRYLAFLTAVVEQQAELVARWLLIGFIHGVMNTDNCSVSGETIDYGPCAFMDAYDPATVFSSIDHAGRYAYSNQPRIAFWNLSRLAETLLPLMVEEAGTDADGAVAAARQALGSFAPVFEAAYFGGLRRKIGLASEQPEDAALTQDLLDVMAAGGADFTLTFRHLCDAAAKLEQGAAARAQFSDPGAYDSWAERWHARLAKEASSLEAIGTAMRSVNPLIIPRNHMVEAALSAATNQADYAPFEALLQAVTHPFEDRPDLSGYTQPPTSQQRVLQTFCGT